MQEFLRFALIGVGVGALYCLASQGLIVVYRGSGVINFAQGAIGMIGAYLAWEFQYKDHLSYALAFPLGVLGSALIGAAAQLVLMRRLTRASPLARIAATLGILILLQALATIRYSTNVTVVPSSLPTNALHFFGNVSVSTDRVILLGIAVLASAALWALYKFTQFGLATSAVAENQRSAASLGWSPETIATANWALGSALAGVAAILISPIIQLQVTTMTNLVLAAMAAALVASFRSFMTACIAGVVIGMIQSVVQLYSTAPGVPQSVPFVVIVLVMVIRGQTLPLRDFFLQRLPSVGSGRIRPAAIAVGIGLTVLLVQLLDPTWEIAIATSFATALVLLSVVTLTGYTGQISFAQYVFAGLGAYIAGRLASALGVPFFPAFLIGVFGMVPIGILFALPAVRTRGINLAILTMGIGSAIELVLFNSPAWTGGEIGTIVPSPTLFGWSLDSVLHPIRFTYFSMVVFIIFALAVANLRRGRTGRRLLAVRTNERAAAALGISVRSVKLYIFGLSAGIAAAGGIIIAFETTNIYYANFTSFTSVTAVAWGVLGGIGYIMGSFVGAQFSPGTLGDQWLRFLASGLGEYLQVIGGVLLMLTVVLNQDGIVKEQIRQLHWIRRKALNLVKRSGRPAQVTKLPNPTGVERVARHVLEVKNLGVRYGGVVAVNDVSLTVQAGEIVGLIGPNGAGKTTTIDAITGFVPRATGGVYLDGRDISKLSVERRCHLGVSRSFQALELFDDLTVMENIRTGCDPRDALSYVRDLVYPVNAPLPSEVIYAIRQFRLEDVLDWRIEDLSYGRRRLVAIVRALAGKPGILLLDEPAAGLGAAEAGDLAELVRRLPDEWGMGILLVEHNMDFVMSVCDHVVVLDFGQKIAEGTVEEIRDNPTVVAAYLGDEVDVMVEEGAR